MQVETLGRLWKRYLFVRAALAHGGGRGSEELAREASRLKERLLINYSPLVKYVAGRVYARGRPGPATQSDLISWGLPGLMDAIETYELDRQTKFETYAISKIRWAVLDQARKEDPLPRKSRAKMSRAQRVRDELYQRLGREPDEAEISEELGISLEEYHSLLAEKARSQVVSLEATPGGDDAPYQGAGQITAEDQEGDPQVRLEGEERRAAVVEGMRSLDEQQRLAVTLYYHEGLTLREIGRAMELTESRISQILSKARSRLRTVLSEEQLTPCAL